MWSRLLARLVSPLAAAALLALVWGSEWLVNLHLAGLPRLRISALRCFIAALFLLPFALQKPARLKPVAYGGNVLLGIGMIAAPLLLSSLATNLSSGLSVVLFGLLPLLATLVEGDNGITGFPYMLGGLLGVAFLVRGSLSFSASQGLSMLWIVLAVLSLAVSMVRSRRWLQTQNLTGAITVQMLSAAVTIGIYSLVVEQSTGAWSLAQRLSLGVLGIVGNALGYVLFYRVLRALRASQVAALQWVMPAVSVLEAALWLRHLPAWDKAAGAILAVACAVGLLRTRTDNSDPTTDELRPLTLKITLL